jgi:hypothetical protein
MSEEMVLPPSDPELEQVQLALEGESIYIDRTELVRNYTGDRFKAYYPDRYAVAVKLIAANQFSDRTIGRFVHADYRTIQQIRLSCIKDIEIQREMLKEKFFTGMMVLADKTIELVDSAKKPAEAAIPMGIMKDSWLQVAGLPTATIEVNHHFDIGKEIDRLHKEAEEVFKEVQGRVVEPPQLTEGEAA